jgi:hypothetical protein
MTRARGGDECGCGAVCKPGSVLDRGRGVTIHLGRALPRASRNLPERSTRKRVASEDAAAPIRSCSRWGLPCRRRCRKRGALLPHPFTLTRRCLAPEGAASRAGGLLSVALSLGSPPPAVTRHRLPVEPGLSSRHAIGCPATCRAATRPPRTRGSCRPGVALAQARDGGDQAHGLGIEHAIDPRLTPVPLEGGDDLRRLGVRQIEAVADAGELREG